MRRSEKVRAMSIEEASDFWDVHDFTEFEDIEEVKGIRFSLKKRSTFPWI